MINCAWEHNSLWTLQEPRQALASCDYDGPTRPNTLHHAKRLELFQYPRLVALPEARPETEALKG